MILSIDTFSDNFSVSILTPDSKVVGCINLLKPKPFSEILLVEINQLLRKSAVNKTDLSAVVVNKGPGSNTGLRVGAITGKTISYILSIPLYSYVSLDVMAYTYKHFCGIVLPCIKIGKGMVAYKIFEKDKQIKPLTVESFDRFLDRYSKEENILIVEKNLNIKSENSISFVLPLSVIGGVYALEKNSPEDLFSFEPIYHS